MKRKMERIMNEYVLDVCSRAKKASTELAKLNADKKNQTLQCVIEALIEDKQYIFDENAKDVAAAEESSMNSAMVDRLKINEKRFESMLQALKDIIKLNDPIGEYSEIKKREDGLLIGRMRAPLGVVFMIYESRPNVTIDAAALCFKSGNSAILRGGKEAIHSNIALYRSFKRGLSKGKVNEDAVIIVEKTARELVKDFLNLPQYIDLVIPRGGEKLVNFVVSESLIPVIRHDKGLCHTYVERDFDKNEAIKIVLDAKTQRTSVCNATETLLIHKDFPYSKELIDALIHKGVEVRGCSAVCEIEPRVKPAKEEDWDTEYLDMIISVRIVDSFEQAVSHINRHGSKHTEAILTNDFTYSERFKQEVDAACVFINTSTRLSDGAEFGLGAEIGISNQKLHWRGPMALEGLSSLKYVVVGRGHTKG